MARFLRRAALIVGSVGVLGALLALAPTSVFAADASTPKITVNFFQALLIGLGYYLANSPWLFGLGFFTIYRPLAAGFFVGLILGDPAQGTLIGAAINLAYLGFISAGGSLPGDPALAGWLGTTLALAGSLSYTQALALAVPIGLLGTIVWNTRMTFDSIFAHWADDRAERGDIAGVALMNWLPSQILLFVITFFPVFFAALSGTQAVVDVMNTLPIWVLNGLAVAGGVLAAIGIAMNMRFIFRGAVIPYFFLGYFLMVATHNGIPMVLVAIFGVVLAFLHVTFVGERGGAAMTEATGSVKAASGSSGAAGA